MSDVALTKKSKDAKIIQCTKILMGICGAVLLLCAVSVFLNREGIAEQYRVRELLSEITSASGSSLQSISADIDDEEKSFLCTLVVKDSFTTDTCNAARKAIDKYLNVNKNFFLNNGYLIRLTIKTKSNGPHLMTTSNQNYFANSNELYDNLSSLEINADFKFSDFNDISSYRNWTDIRTLWIWSVNMDDISVLSQFTELEYISKHDGFTIQETQAIEQMLPNCKIVSY